ncbi:MAG: ABC transporter permease subunit, partial [Verrucomicrobiales bacterium]
MALMAADLSVPIFKLFEVIGSELGAPIDLAAELAKGSPAWPALFLRLGLIAGGIYLILSHEHRRKRPVGVALIAAGTLSMAVSFGDPSALATAASIPSAEVEKGAVFKISAADRLASFDPIYHLARWVGTGLNWAADKARPISEKMPWVFAAATFLGGLWLLIRGPAVFHFNPLTQRKMKRFHSITRGYISMWVLIGLVFVACLDNLIVGNKALIVKYGGAWYFPFAAKSLYPESEFGGEGEAPANYRALQRRFEIQGGDNWVLMPVVPFATKLDAEPVVGELREAGGKLLGEDGSLFSGTAYRVFTANPAQKRSEFKYLDGLRDGPMRGWNLSGEQVEKGEFAGGSEVSREFFGEGSAEELDAAAAGGYYRIVYPPSPPSWKHRRFLGTDAQGNDLFARMFGGLQQMIGASLIYVILIYVAGVIIGCAMGYFGGLTDLLGQRLIEIWSAVPFLFVVMILSQLFRPVMVVLVMIISFFSWMSITYYMRTGTYREKARDYVDAARLQGVGAWRIITKHILPNTLATLVTLIPFSVVSIIGTITALDFLGFGLAPEEPSWGRTLQEGTSNIIFPWIVLSAFSAIASTLILVTFVGEAVREAFDPKKFTTYQ